MKFINNALIICQDHPNVALTSNLPYGELSSEATKLIAQIHLATKEEVKQEIIEELEKINSKEKDLKDTVYGDYSEIETLKIENQLLKQLNSELKDKNKILNELFTKEKQGKNNETKTYAGITVKPKPKSKRVPKLIIKKTDNKDNTGLQKTVLQHLQQDKSIQTKSVACKKKDTMIINCMNEKNINSLINSLGEKLSNKVKIEKEQINKPKLKVIDIDMDSAENNEIELDTNQRNFSNIDDKCKLLHVYTNETKCDDNNTNKPKWIAVLTLLMIYKII